MNEVMAAAADLQEFCLSRGWRFCFIGGVAVQRWSLPRYTEHADMTLITNFVEDKSCCRLLLERFRGRRVDAFDFAQRTRVLLLLHESGVELDVALGALAFENRSVERASYWTSSEGIKLFTCSAEDLIMHKAFASRADDWKDIERTIAVQGKKLNVTQILDELRPLAALKEDDGIITQLEWRMKKRGLL